MNLDELDRLNRFVAVLYTACGLQPIELRPMDAGHITMWWTFIQAMRPLENTPGGPLTPADVKAVIKMMRAQNRAGKASWALRPVKLLRDPELFLDLVLQCRKPTRSRPAPVTESRQVGNGSTMVEIDPAMDVPAAEDFRRQMREDLERLKIKAEAHD